MLTIFYDGFCPLCVAEMRSLKREDNADLIRLEDINAEDFSDRYPTIEAHEARRILHGLDAQGELLLGLDVSHRAWKLVAPASFNARLLGLLRKPLLRKIADLGYRFFARYRYQISFLLTGKSRCNTCALPR